MKSNLALQLALLALTSYSMKSFAVECNVKVPIPAGQIEVKYAGGCKDGLASGEGKYSWSRVDKATGEKVVAQVSGTFLNGVPNGESKTVSSNGAWTVGTFRDGNRVDTVAVFNDDGVRIGILFKEGKQVGLCRADTAQPRCTPELQKLLSLRQPPGSQTTSSLLAQLVGGSSQPFDPSVGTTEKASFQVVGSGPISGESAGRACARPLSKGDTSKISHLQFFPPVDASSLGGSDAAMVNTKVGQVYPVMVRARNISALTNIQNNRRGFIYKNAYGEWICVTGGM